MSTTTSTSTVSHAPTAPVARRARSLASLAGATAVLTAGALLAGPAQAAGPARETVELERTFVNGGLSEACGFDVVQALAGSFRIATFVDRDGEAVREISMVKFRSTLSANGVTVDSRSSGPTVSLFSPDGTVTSYQNGVTMRNAPGFGTLGPNAGRFGLVILPDGTEVELVSSGMTRSPSDGLCEVLAG
ncbi:MAG TPA: hypothetical protein VK894_09630 [Jiangellales bacterium]|nr:hypothetical protein [Jiangellales bacterium]